MEKMMDHTECANIDRLPPEKIPRCWNDDEAMSALFSPVRSKNANPQDWTSKYKFWNNVIYEWLKHNMQCSFSIADLHQAFKRKGCTPLCLTTVVEELLRNNKIIPEDEFLREPGNTWTEWSIDVFIKKPLTWSISKVKGYVIGQQINTQTKYIHLDIVQELGNIIICAFKDEKENEIVPISEIQKQCMKKTDDHNITENSIRLALIWLKHIKKAAFGRNLITEHNELLVKISSHTLQEITEVEECLYKLLQQEDQILKDIKFMEQQKVNITSEIKEYLAKDLRQVAKTQLIKKKALEKTIIKRAHALENVRTLILSIRDSRSDSAIFTAYKSGSNVLKQIANSKLTADDVRDVMDDISEALEDHMEMETTLSRELNNSDSDLDLEKELADLLNSTNESPMKPSNSNIQIEVKDFEQFDKSRKLFNTNTQFDLKDLEQQLADLQVEDIPFPGESSNKSSTVPLSQKKKLLSQPDHV